MNRAITDPNTLAAAAWRARRKADLFTGAVEIVSGALGRQREAGLDCSRATAVLAFLMVEAEFAAIDAVDSDLAADDSATQADLAMAAGSPELEAA